eukprot:TRINITY_DN7546_c0_g1_i1.p1 TRINITY_DN7546_c0_g1~~TRINITY_DN7546_c0_g1_i1.p1  ORF type:complete len:218 (+),score=7.83 TRINITY_DN7546_c0_g1_i1:89-742(+)
MSFRSALVQSGSIARFARFPHRSSDLGFSFRMKSTTMDIMATSEFIIRKYEPRDHERVVTLFVDGMLGNMREAGYDKNVEIMTGHRRYLKSSQKTDLGHIQEVYFDKGGYFWVVTGTNEFKDEIVGMVGLQQINDKEAELRRMSVDVRARRRGVGDLLLKTLDRYARSKNYERIVLSTLDAFFPARKMYERFGFEFERDQKEGQLTVVFYKKNLLQT